MINRSKVIFRGLVVFITIAIFYAGLQSNLILYSSPSLTAPVPQEQSSAMAIDTPGCQIPLLNPMHPSIAQMVKRSPPLNCSHPHPAAPVVPGNDSKNPTIKLVRENLLANGSKLECSYRSIYRKTEKKTEENSQSIPIDKDEIVVTDEFIKVECMDRKNVRLVYVNYFPFIQKKESVEKRCENTKKRFNLETKAKDERLSVLILGIDSASKNQFLRHMKKCHAYLKQNTTYVDMMGYNRIGQNTYPNMIPLFTGHLESELPDISHSPADVLPLVWNEFARDGYRTLMSEDFPAITMFNYARKGFKHQPTDYYLRPFSKAVESSSVFKRSTRGCFNGGTEADVVLGWTADFFDAFPDDPLFAFTFLSRLSHDRLNELGTHDEPFRRFMMRLRERGHLDRTVVFFMSDHGFRFGDLSSTYIGHVEKNLPFLFVLIPPWLPRKYPDVYDNLKTNGRRLVTTLDLHATLKTIKNFPVKVPTTSYGRSVSLLGAKISPNRTCLEANISHQFCACSRAKQLQPTDQHVLKSTKKLIKVINKKTKTYRRQCAKLHLDTILHATMEQVHSGEDKSEKASSNYFVTFIVLPSGGIFEGTVFHHAEEDTYQPDVNIERLNLYGNQSSCIDVAKLKPYCYCI